MPLVLYVACACFLVTVGAVCPAGQAPTLSGGCAPCRPGTHKAAAGSAACTGCVIGSDSAAGSAECECHAGYVYSASGDACIACPAGTHYSGQQCKPCPVDTYSETRAALTVDVCQRCPPLSNAPAGSVDRFACSCKAGTGGPHGGPCVGCVAGSYKTLFSSGIVDGSYSMSVGVCILCPAGSISVPGGHLVASCRCRPGFIGADGGPCTPCEADTAKAHTGPGTCTPCPGNSSAELGSAVCGCPPGTTGSMHACVACAPDTYKSLSGAEPCTRCNTHASSPTASVSATSCVCNAGHGGLDGGICTACAAGSYRLGVQCRACPVGSWSPVSSATIFDCACLWAYVRPETRSALYTVVRQDRVCRAAWMAAEMLCWTGNGSAWSPVSALCTPVSEVDCQQRVALSPHRVVLVVDGFCMSPALPATGPQLFGADTCSFVSHHVYYQQFLCRAPHFKPEVPVLPSDWPCAAWDPGLVAGALAVLSVAHAEDTGPLAAFVTHYDVQHFVGRAVTPSCEDLFTRVMTRLNTNSTSFVARSSAASSPRRRGAVLYWLAAGSAFVLSRV